MDRELLRKVQMQQLEIAEEIKRVCDENNIQYFLCFGTMLGAVRHQGFIPWDDDLDMGMLRSEYERFLEIAPQKLKPEYLVQTWYNTPEYPLPFAKVRKRGTVYLEGKHSLLQENGFYVDIFPFDSQPASDEERMAVNKKLQDLFRTKLMKCKSKPWMENGKILWKKRIGYLYYQAKALTASQEALAKAYDSLATSFPESDILFWQEGISKMRKIKRSWCEELAEFNFEGVMFKGPKNYDEMLTTIYGNYMQLPPEDQRENRHQIEVVDFGK
jgi:lipopolysaccharide cholinephosphotransferase